MTTIGNSTTRLEKGVKGCLGIYSDGGMAGALIAEIKRKMAEK